MVQNQPTKYCYFFNASKVRHICKLINGQTIYVLIFILIVRIMLSLTVSFNWYRSAKIYQVARELCSYIVVYFIISISFSSNGDSTQQIDNVCYKRGECLSLKSKF